MKKLQPNTDTLADERQKCDNAKMGANGKSCRDRNIKAL